MSLMCFVLRVEWWDGNMELVLLDGTIKLVVEQVADEEGVAGEGVDEGDGGEGVEEGGDGDATDQDVVRRVQQVRVDQVATLLARIVGTERDAPVAQVEAVVAKFNAGVAGARSNAITVGSEIARCIGPKKLTSGGTAWAGGNIAGVDSAVAFALVVPSASCIDTKKLTRVGTACTGGNNAGVSAVAFALVVPSAVSAVKKQLTSGGTAWAEGNIAGVANLMSLPRRRMASRMASSTRMRFTIRLAPII